LDEKFAKETGEKTYISNLPNKNTELLKEDKNLKKRKILNDNKIEPKKIDKEKLNNNIEKIKKKKMEQSQDIKKKIMESILTTKNENDENKNDENFFENKKLLIEENLKKKSIIKPYADDLSNFHPGTIKNEKDHQNLHEFFKKNYQIYLLCNTTIDKSRAYFQEMFSFYQKEKNTEKKISLHDKIISLYNKTNNDVQDLENYYLIFHVKLSNLKLILNSYVEKLKNNSM
jgi:hypothetical protein